MQHTIILTPDNTTVKENTMANVSILVNLTPYWDHIKRYDRFYLYTSLQVPTILNDQKKTVQIAVHNYYNVCDINSSSDIIITQKSYIEGTLDTSLETISESCVYLYRISD